MKKVLPFSLFLIIYSGLYAQQEIKSTDRSNEHKFSCLTCEKKSRAATSDSLYIPNEETPIKVIQCNLIFLHKDDGSGGFDPKTDDKVWNDVEKQINETLSSLHTSNTSQTSTDCYSGLIEDSRIRIHFDRFYIDSTIYWDNKNGEGVSCPGSDAFFLEPLDKQLRQDKKYPNGINVFFTESQAHFNKYLKGESIVSSFSKQGCSLTSSCEVDNTTMKINMKSVHLDFLMKQSEEPPLFPGTYFDKTQESPPSDSKNTYWWFVSETAGGVLHEICHCMFTDTHHRNYCADHVMRQTNPRSYLTPLDLGEMHRQLAMGTASKYVIPYESANEVYALKQNMVVDYDWRCVQNIVIKKGGILTVKCRIRMPLRGTITIKRGGKLIIDGGVITAAYDGLWNGVVIPKIRNKKKAGAANFIELKNGGVLQRNVD